MAVQYHVFGKPGLFDTPEEALAAAAGQAPEPKPDPKKKASEAPKEED